MTEPTPSAPSTPMPKPRLPFGLEFSAEGLALRIVNGDLRDEDYACIRVRDNGDGMTRDIAERIFDPFFTTKDVDKGSGLGLAAIEGIS